MEETYNRNMLKAGQIWKCTYPFETDYSNGNSIYTGYTVEKNTIMTIVNVYQGKVAGLPGEYTELILLLQDSKKVKRGLPLKNPENYFQRWAKLLYSE
jgi:hypothetical protein